LDKNLIKNYQLRWRLNQNTSSYRKNLQRAITAIHAAYATGKCSSSLSGGKDSVVVTHLAKTLYPDIEIITQFDDCDWAEKEPYLDALSKKYSWTIHKVYPKNSVWEQFLKSNIGYDDICATTNPLTKESFLAPLKEKQAELNIDVVMLGLRAEESLGRKMNYRKNGELYQLKDKEWHCCPIGNWRTIDVFTYLTVNDVDINPCYFYNAFQKPEDIRVCWALPTPRGFSEGIFEHLRKYYPEQFKKLREHNIQV